MKSLNPRHYQACSQNKGLSTSCGLAHPLLETGARGQPEPERGNRSPREASSTKLQTGSIANQEFLGFWMVDIHWEGHSQTSAPQKRHMAHLRRCACCTPRKPSGWDGGGNKMHHPPGGDCTRQAPGHLSCPDLGRAQNTGPTESMPLGSTQEPEPERLSLESARNPGPTSDSFRQSNLEREKCRLGKHTCHEQRQTQCS